MKIKRYIVKDMNEAMIKIRYELGKDALIVSNRWIRKKGIKGFFQKKDLEVIAAIDEKGRGSKNHNQEKNSSEIKNIFLEQEFQELKAEVNQLLKEKEKEENYKDKKKNQKIVFLKKLGFEEVFIESFSEYLKKADHSTEDSDLLYQYFEKFIKEKILIKEDGKEKIWIFIGPTGVGKTTTIAKIAAKETIENEKKVGLITLDTYRIGAVEQLSIYARILDIPLEIVMNPSDLLEAIQKLKDCDLILIDSTGGSCFNKKYLIETKKFLREIDQKRTVLLVSATTGNQDLKNIIQNYNSIGYDSIIMTKLDETQYYGRIFNIYQYTDKPLLFITTGQNVPKDILKVTEENLLDYFFNEVII
ncbi:GTP-binding protein [Garciella nitratireducens]|uniref:GTP-binding protein n=1 Tax=Garciella nitratireducens TaxID=218205 RepID=UPI001BD3176A|nr:flagellar biosynthesis protein FlhF [Garciella nitratireducens]